MAKETVVATGGIGIGGLVFVVLFALKLMGEIQLHWGWVLTSFLWVPLLLTLIVVAVLLALAGVFWLLGKL